MNLAIHPATLPADYAMIAAVLAAESPGWAATAEELAYEDARRDPRYHHATFVAEEVNGAEPLMVGVAFTGHDPLAHREGKFFINLRVHPDWQGLGIGKALYQAVLDHLTALAPQELHAFVWHAHPRTPRFLLERGFVEAWRRVDLTLDVTNFAFAPYIGLEEAVKAKGIVIKTYADLADDPDRVVKLYELDWALWQDIPYGEEITKRSLEQFVTSTTGHPDFLADACFVAVKGSDFVGYLNLLAADDGFSTDMTGVLPGYRNQGVATLLKLYSIRFAQVHGNRPLYTQNDPVNQAMLGLNQKLGFVLTGANVRFVKKLV